MLLYVFPQLGSSSYAVYHSVHDNFFWMTHFGDPTFTHHLAVGLVWSKMAILIATTPVLPYDPRYYALAVERIYESVKSEYGAALEEQNITLGITYMYIRSSVYKLYRNWFVDYLASTPDEVRTVPLRRDGQWNKLPYKYWLYTYTMVYSFDMNVSS